MEPFMLLIVLISVTGIFMIFGLSYVKVENDVLNQFHAGSQDFNSFMTKIKGNLSKVKR